MTHPVPSNPAPPLEDGELEFGGLEHLPDVEPEACEDDIDVCH